MNSNAEKWVKALRSGEFKQAQKKLRDGDKFCCLGVACEVFRLETGEGEWVTDVFQLDAEGVATVLPRTVKNWLGLTDNTGGFHAGGFQNDGSLARMNDNEGANFARIADKIEEGPEGLFKSER